MAAKKKLPPWMPSAQDAAEDKADGVKPTAAEDAAEKKTKKKKIGAGQDKGAFHKQGGLSGSKSTFGSGGDVAGTTLQKPSRGRTTMVRGPGGTAGYDAGSTVGEQAAGASVAKPRLSRMVGMGQSGPPMKKPAAKKKAGARKKAAPRQPSMTVGSPSPLAGGMPPAMATPPPSRGMLAY